MATVLYSTLIGDDEAVEEIPAQIISYSYRLNRPGNISFSLAIDHPLCTRDVIDPGKHEIVVERDKAIVWRGPVLTASENAATVEFGGAGLLAYLDRWYLTSGLTYTTVDQFTIARGLLNHHLDKAGAGFGVDTTGADTSGVTRDRTYEAGKNIGEALTELAETQSGFDFDIDHDTRLFRMHYPTQGTRQPDLIIEDGIRSFGRTLDATSQASQVLGFGEGEGDSQVRASKQDSSAVSAYKLTQRKYQDQDIKTSTTLEGHVTRELAYHKTPPQTVSVTVGTDSFNYFQYGLGVEGRLKYDSPYGAVNEYRRIVGADIVWNAGDEQAVLYLAPVVTV